MRGNRTHTLGKYGGVVWLPIILINRDIVRLELVSFILSFRSVAHECVLHGIGSVLMLDMLLDTLSTVIGVKSAIQAFLGSQSTIRRRRRILVLWRKCLPVDDNKLSHATAALSSYAAHYLRQILALHLDRLQR